MRSRLNPYLSFKGNTRQAMEFYQTVFGGELDLRTFDELHAAQDPSEGNLIMHAVLTTNNDLTLMAADLPKGLEYKPGTNVTLSLSGENETELRGYWDKLVEGATITQPLEKAQWGDTFGMLTDKFGTLWMMNITAPKQ